MIPMKELVRYFYHRKKDQDYREIFAEYCSVHRSQKKIVIHNGVHESLERGVVSTVLEDACEENLHYVCVRCTRGGEEVRKWSVNVEKECLCERCLEDWIKYASKNQQKLPSMFLI